MKSPNPSDHNFVDRLSEGCVVSVTEIVDNGDFRIRGKIDGGWISMIDLLDDNRFVMRSSRRSGKKSNVANVTYFLTTKNKKSIYRARKKKRNAKQAA